MVARGPGPYNVSPKGAMGEDVLERGRGVVRAFLRAVRRAILALVAALAVVAAVVVVRGYGLYRETVESTPIEAVVEQARSDASYVSADRLPQTYLEAVVAVEDHRFYEHPGFDVIAICRAAWYDLTTLSLEQGGSTITQQLAKNLFLSQEKDFSRKVAEVFLALDLEGLYDKDEILELYVNTCYFGDGLVGIGEASWGYLGKDPSLMGPWECALMAGLPNAPNALSSDPALAWERAEVVVSQMERYGYDTECFE